MQKILKTILLLLIPLGLLAGTIGAYALDENLPTGARDSENSAVDKNTHLENIKNIENDYIVSRGGEQGIYYTLVRIAKDIKNVFFFIAGLFFLILVIMLIFSESSEEDIEKFKKGIVWISIGLMVMQISYSIVLVLFDRGVGQGLAYNFIDRVIDPIIDLLSTGAAFFFIAIAIYAFYRMVTTNGNEEEAKSGKMSIVYAIIGFVVIRFAKTIVDTTYGTIDCDGNNGGIFQVIGNNCINKGNLSGFNNTIVDIINWANGLIGIVIIVMIIFAGFQIIFFGGNEDKLKKGMHSVIYIAIGLFLLFANYLILTFFILPESTI